MNNQINPQDATFTKVFINGRRETIKVRVWSRIQYFNSLVLEGMKSDALEERYTVE